jgi:hypothetical protein
MCFVCAWGCMPMFIVKMTTRVRSLFVVLFIGDFCVCLGVHAYV